MRSGYHDTRTGVEVGCPAAVAQLFEKMVPDDKQFFLAVRRGMRLRTDVILY